MTWSMWTTDRPGPAEIIDVAVRLHSPIATYVGYSGGNDSLRVTHWAMTNISGCQVVHINTGIGIERTREHVRAVCKDRGWPLNEIRAKEDCGQDYDDICRKHGFPGPQSHLMMYTRLKERCVDLLTRRAKAGHSRRSKVMILSGAQHADSLRRMAYAGREINHKGSQLWVNPFYWSPKAERDAYIAENNLPINPVTKILGMSGECGCGAFAHPGELRRWREADPAFGERIDRLSQEVLEAGFTWSWEAEPPRGGRNLAQTHLMPLCGASCFKSAVVQSELTEEINTK